MHKGEWVECTERGGRAFRRRTEKKCDFCRQLLEAGKGKMLRTSPRGFLYEGDLEGEKKGKRLSVWGV